MDPFSLAIVVTVLSLGSMLVYLFKADFDSRHKILITQSSNNKKNVSSATLSRPNNKQKVPSVVSKPITIPDSIKPSTQQPKQNVSSNKSKAKDNDSVAPIKFIEAPQPINLAHSLIPSEDELDVPISAVFMKPTLASRPGKSTCGGKKLEPSSTPQQQQALDSKKMARRKENAVVSDEPISPKRLFSLLEASNLSKDEVEFAVETLLNKLESGESNWQQLKSDPLSRLKARLRDNETALATEISNHESTRLRLGVINLALDQARGDLGRLKEENSQLNSKLDQVCCDLSNYQRMQRKLKEEKLQVMAQLENVEQSKAQLHAKLIERDMNETSMKETLLEMEGELKELEMKLIENSGSIHEGLRKEMELNIAYKREEKLLTEMRELAEGLSDLFPDFKSARVGTEGWVDQCLASAQQVAKAMNELREANNNNSITAINSNAFIDTSSKIAKDKATSTEHLNRLSSRVSSPVSNGRSSRAGSLYDSNGKKTMETKYLELKDYVIKLEDDIAKTKQDLDLAQAAVKLSEGQSGSSNEQLLIDLHLQRSKLEAQVRIGLDSLKMEQEKSKSLEEELSKFSHEEARIDS